MTGEDTSGKILEAAGSRLLADDCSPKSTRKVPDEAGTRLGQIHYPFGSKDESILTLLRAENDGLLERQTELSERDLPLWERWDPSCDHLDQDLVSRYIRVFREMMAAGWSSKTVGKEIGAKFGERNKALVGKMTSTTENSTA